MSVKEDLQEKMQADDVKYVIREKVNVKSRIKQWWSGFSSAEDGSFIWLFKQIIYWIKLACDTVTEFFKARAEEKKLKREAMEAGVDTRTE